ncbi:MAG: hypothetical protein WCO63_13800 [Bacteroidota bacterium]
MKTTAIVVILCVSSALAFGQPVIKEQKSRGPRSYAYCKFTKDKIHPFPQGGVKAEIVEVTTTDVRKANPDVPGSDWLPIYENATIIQNSKAYELSGLKDPRRK